MYYVGIDVAKENPNDLIILSSNQAIKVIKAIAKITPGIA